MNRFRLVLAVLLALFVALTSPVSSARGEVPIFLTTDHHYLNTDGISGFDADRFVMEVNNLDNPEMVMIGLVISDDPSLKDNYDTQMMKIIEKKPGIAVMSKGRIHNQCVVLTFSPAFNQFKVYGGSSVGLSQTRATQIEQAMRDSLAKTSDPTQASIDSAATALKLLSSKEPVGPTPTPTPTQGDEHVTGDRPGNGWWMAAGAVLVGVVVFGVLKAFRRRDDN